MRLSLTLIALCATLVSAFTLPANLTDGDYRVTATDDGQEIHEQSTGPADHEWKVVATLEGTTPAEVPALHSRIVARQLPYVYCGCGYYLNHAECDTATQAMRNQIGNGANIPYKQAFFSISGGTVVFACNYGQNGWQPASAHITQDIFSNALGMIDNACGRYVAGTSKSFAFQPPFVKRGYQSPWMGHQQYRAGDDFCSTSLASNKDHC